MSWDDLTPAQQQVELDLIDAELCRRRPDWEPLSAAAKLAIAESVYNAPPMSLEACARVGRLLGW